MPTRNMDSQIERAIESFNNQDPDGFVAGFAEEGTFLDPMQENELTRTELGEYFAELFEGFPDVYIDEKGP